MPVKFDRIGGVNLDVLKRGTAHGYCTTRTLYRDSIVAPEYRLVPSCWSQVPRSTATRAGGRAVLKEKLGLTNKMWTLTASMAVEISN